MLWYQWRCLPSRRDIPENVGDDGLPPEYFQGHVLLVAGNPDAWVRTRSGIPGNIGMVSRVDTPADERSVSGCRQPSICAGCVVAAGTFTGAAYLR